MSWKAVQGLSAGLFIGLSCAQADPMAHPPAPATWAPFDSHGAPTRRRDLPDSAFAFPGQRKEPMTDRAHVRAAITRFDQVIGVSDDDRALAFANIRKAADYYGVALTATDWTQLGATPHTGRTAADRQASARKAADTRRRRAALGE
jgi:hypothetical protein